MAYGSFGMRDGHFVRYGANVRIVPGDRPARRRRYRRRRPNPPSGGTQAMSSSPSSPSLSDTAREVLASPPVRDAIAGAIAGFIRSGPAGALSGGAAGALSGGRQLALPPPPGE